MGIILRQVKGSKLTIDEMDGNLTFLNGSITANTETINTKLDSNLFFQYTASTSTIIDDVTTFMIDLNNFLPTGSTPYYYYDSYGNSIGIGIEFL